MPQQSVIPAKGGIQRLSKTLMALDDQHSLLKGGSPE